MRFKEFLLREQDAPTLIDGLNKIKEECAEFLSDVKGTLDWLYRGMEDESTKTVFRRNHIIGRDPKDSSFGFNVFFNAGVELAHGISMVRHTAVFTTGEKAVTKSYGDTYFVFPTKNYKYIWSKQITDSYVRDYQLFNDFARNLSELTEKPVADSTEIKNAFGRISDLSGDNIKRAVDNLRTHDELVEKAFHENDVEASVEEIDMALKKTFSSYYKANEGLLDAIRTKNEIIFYKSDGMYYVPIALIQSHINSNKDLEGQSPEEFLDTFFWGA